MKERVVIIFIALVFGLLLTTVAFYLYQTTKVIPRDEVKKTAQKNSANQTSKSKVFLSIDEPTDEEIVGVRTIQVKGKTDAGNTVVVSSNLEDVVANPTSTGQFAVTIGIDAGANILTIRSISPNGDEASEDRMVTYSQEDF
ncbi:hypothetical protein M1349_02805 [Patescibacteria group bacterium]|nr:hypothetical protein [Patescibacteria group bacterium]